MIEIGKKYVTHGCFHPENNGKIVVVLGLYLEREIAHFEGLSASYGDWWEIDKELVFNRPKTNIIPEASLKPIDDDWDTPVEWEECVWKPDEIKT